MKIHAKLVSFVSVALVVPLLLGVYYVRHFGRLYYQKQQGIIYLMVAEEMAGTLQDGIRQKFQQILNWVSVSALSSMAAGIPVALFSAEEIQTIESTWSSSSTVTGVEQAILSNPLSNSIRAFQRVNPEFAEILMTDRYGRLIGATHPTTDYWQADEAWWKSASGFPAGDGLIEGLLYDESAGVLVIDMVFPVYDPEHPNDFIGVLKVSLHATRFLLRAAPRPWSKELARDIIFPDGRVFARISAGESPDFSRISGETLQQLLTAPERWRTVELNPGTLSLAAAVPMQVMDESPGWQEEPKDTRELYVVVSRDLDKAMMPVREVLRLLTVWGIVAVLLIAVISYLLATYWFARPIKKLRKASMSFVDYIRLSEQGHYEESWESRQKVRQRMNELETIRSRDELQGLSRDFIRMGERMLVFFRQIEERLTDKKPE